MEIIFLEENDLLDCYKYEILVLMGRRKGVGIIVDVCCNLIGLEGESGLCLLRDLSEVCF